MVLVRQHAICYHGDVCQRSRPNIMKKLRCAFSSVALIPNIELNTSPLSGITFITHFMLVTPKWQR